MSNIKKMIVTDLDNTLLNDNKQISNKNYTAIKSLLNNNHKVVFASGRSYDNIKTNLLNYYNLKIPVISLNGAQIHDESGILIKEETLKLKALKNIMNSCDNFGLFYMLFSENQTFVNIPPNLLYNLYLLSKQKSSNIRNTLKGMQIYYNLLYNNNIILNEELKKNIIQEKIKLLKIEIIGYDIQALSRISTMVPLNVNITSSTSVNLEITQNNAAKEKAMIFLSSYYKVQLKNIYALGDSLNDLEMIRKAGCGASVSNANNLVKQNSDLIVCSYSQDGFYEFANLILKNLI